MEAALQYNFCNGWRDKNQLRSLIKRRNVINEPKKNMNAREDFFLQVVDSPYSDCCNVSLQDVLCEDHPCTAFLSEGSSELNLTQ